MKKVRTFDDPIALLKTDFPLKQAKLTRCQIVEAAERVFIADGTVGMNLSSVVAESNVKSSSSILYHFKSTERLIRAARDYRWLPINIYRQELFNRMLAAGFDCPGAGFYSILAPISWAAQSVGEQSVVARAIYVHQSYVISGQNADPPSPGREVYLHIVEHIRQRLLDIGRLDEEEIDERTSLMAMGIPAQLAATEVDLASGCLDIENAAEVWRDSLRRMYEFSSALFEYTPVPIAELERVNDDLQADLGDCPNWRAIADFLGIV